MGKKRGSLLGNLGWGIGGDILLFATVILLMSLFAITSISKAYIIIFTLLVVAISSFAIRKKIKNNTND